MIPLVGALSVVENTVWKNSPGFSTVVVSVSVSDDCPVGAGSAVRLSVVPCVSSTGAVVPTDSDSVLTASVVVESVCEGEFSVLVGVLSVVDSVCESTSTVLVVAKLVVAGGAICMGGHIVFGLSAVTCSSCCCSKMVAT